MSIMYRYAAVGLTALAVLSAGQWLRARHALPELTWLLGVLPNLSAAVAIPLVTAAALVEMRGRPPGPGALRWLVAASAAGLIGWEVLQLARPRLVFDWADIAATLVGSAFAMILFERLGPRH